MPAPYTADDTGQVVAYWSDCLTQLHTMDDCSVHAVITDPPYGLADHKPEAVAQAITAWASGDRERVPTGKGGFMGRDWDSFVPPPAVWDECLRVLVPGGHLACFAGSRTVDLMGLSIRLAGFEMRDSVDLAGYEPVETSRGAWYFGSGFPKSLDVGKALDKAAGAERGEGVPGRYSSRRPRAEVAATNAYQDGVGDYGSSLVTAPATDAAREWAGYGTALKPAHEPILLARKPLVGTVAGNVLAHGAGGINIDACRVATDDDLNGGAYSGAYRASDNYASTDLGDTAELSRLRRGIGEYVAPSGRWPTNVVLAHHPDCGPDGAPGPCVDGCQVAALDEQSGTTTSNARKPTGAPMFGNRVSGSLDGGTIADTTERGHVDEGGASRFFPTFRYCAKAPKRERPIVDGCGHPTVKPLGLMRWLTRLLCPPGGVVLDPFAGSGSTLEAAQLEGFRAIGIEADEHSCRLIAERLARSIRVEEPPALFA